MGHIRRHCHWVAADTPQPWLWRPHACTTTHDLGKDATCGGLDDGCRARRRHAAEVVAQPNHVPRRLQRASAGAEHRRGQWHKVGPVPCMRQRHAAAAVAPCRCTRKQTRTAGSTGGSCSPDTGATCDWLLLNADDDWPFEPPDAAVGAVMLTPAASTARAGTGQVARATGCAQRAPRH